MNILLPIILIAIAVLLGWLWFKFVKVPHLKNLVYISGTNGCGKSYFSVSLAVRLWKRQVLKAKFKNFLMIIAVNPVRKLFGKPKKPLYEIPLLYSNIKLARVPFVILTKELLYRRERFVFGSVVLLDEASLIADQMTFKDRELNERLSEFFKLFRHETRGGYCIVNSQNISDMHYSLKYCLSEYFYIHHKTTVPFVSLMFVQEVAYSENIDNQRHEDIEKQNKVMVVSNKYFKFYDTYTYSVFTDDLPAVDNAVYFTKDDSLKADLLVSFKEYTYLYENKKKEVVKNEKA